MLHAAIGLELLCALQPGGPPSARGALAHSPHGAAGGSEGHFPPGFQQLQPLPLAGVVCWVPFTGHAHCPTFDRCTRAAGHDGSPACSTVPETQQVPGMLFSPPRDTCLAPALQLTASQDSSVPGVKSGRFPRKAPGLSAASRSVAGSKIRLGRLRRGSANSCPSASREAAPQPKWSASLLGGEQPPKGICSGAAEQPGARVVGPPGPLTCWHPEIKLLSVMV